MYKEVDYKSIISDLNEFLTEKHWDEGWTFNRVYSDYADYINFNDENLWCSEIESSDNKNDCDWTTETLLQHCIIEFKKYRELLNTIEIK